MLKKLRGRMKGSIGPVDIVILIGAAVNLAVIGAIIALWAARG